MGDKKKFYWIKLKTNFFSREDIDFLLSQKNGCQYVVLYQMLCLQTANTNGEMISILGEVIVPYDVNKIVRDTKYFDFDTVTVALELFKKLGLIYQEENGNLKITDLVSMVGSESANYDAIKKREQRLNKKIASIEKDKLGDNQGTNCLTEYRDKSIENRDIDIRYKDNRDKSIENNTLPVPDNSNKKELLIKFENEFEKIWEYYPNKKGKDQAKNKYISARKNGTTYEEVVQGLKNYLNYIKAENVESKYIKHGSTWFNQKCWNDDYKISNQTKGEKVDKQMEILKGVHNGSIKVD